LVSDSLDADGAYAVTFNVAPTISGSDGALGSFSASAPSQSYTVNDANGGTVTVTEKIDGAISDQFTASLGSARTFAIAPQWQQLANGSHTLEVAASDGTLSAVRTWTFTKSVTGFEVVSDVFPADAMPTRCVINIPITSRAVPAGGELKVYVCNNGNDASPAWEEITNYAFAGLIYSFTNTDKTDAAWGVRVKVIGSRGTAGSAVWFSAIGGAFE
jgi:hypothetical protein